VKKRQMSVAATCRLAVAQPPPPPAAPPFQVARATAFSTEHAENSHARYIGSDMSCPGERRGTRVVTERAQPKRCPVRPAGMR